MSFMLEIERMDCCGCAACANACVHRAISMKPDEEGFLYPEIDQHLCKNCGLCERSCPVIREKKVPNIQNVKAVYAAHHVDETKWKNSASGGFFSALSDFVISRGGVVFGAKFDTDWKVVHGFAETQLEAGAFVGSKYVQSDLGSCYKYARQFLKDGRLVLFSGTPCQIEGLNLFLAKYYENLLTCDIICNSVSSPKLFKDYIDFLVANHGEIESINMKDKTKGWKRGSQSPRIKFVNGQSIFDTEETKLWNRIFASKLASRPSCYTCRFTNFNRSGDFSLGDFWHLERSMPDFVDSKGVSVVLVNSKKGLKIFEEMKSLIVFRQSGVEQCFHSKFKRPVAEPKGRPVFWKHYEKKGFERTTRLYWGQNLQWKMLRKLLKFASFL